MPNWLLLTLFLLGTTLVAPLIAGLATGSWREALSAWKGYATWIGIVLAIGAVVAAFMLGLGR